jgi:hypothetical protein
MSLWSSGVSRWLQTDGTCHHAERASLTRLTSYALVACAMMVGAGCVVVKPAQEPATEDGSGAGHPAGATTKQDDAAVSKDMDARVDAALRRGETDAPAALAELAELRLQTIAVQLGRHGLKADPKAASSAPTQDPRERAEPSAGSFLFGSNGFVGSADTSSGAPAPVEKLLRRIKHARGKLLAAAGKRDELVLELAPPGLWQERIESDAVGRRILSYQDVESCAPEETVCKEAYRGLVKATDDGCRISPYVSQVFRESGAEAYVCDFVNETWFPETSKQKPFLYDVRVRAISKTPSGELVIQAASHNPSASKTCDGEYQTDKILSVTASEILVERTTWCQGRRTLMLDGNAFVIRLPKGAFEPRAGDTIRLFVRPKDIAIRKQGRMFFVTVNRPLLTQVNVADGTRYRFGTPFDWQFTKTRASTPSP